MDDLNYKRLKWLAQANEGEKFPEELFTDVPNRWGPAFKEMAISALRDVERLRAMMAEKKG